MNFAAFSGLRHMASAIALDNKSPTFYFKYYNVD